MIFYKLLSLNRNIYMKSYNYLQIINVSYEYLKPYKRVRIIRIG